MNPQKQSHGIKRKHLNSLDVSSLCNQTCPSEFSMLGPVCAVLEENNGVSVIAYRNFHTMCHMRDVNCDVKSQFRFIYRGICTTRNELGHRRNIGSQRRQFLSRVRHRKVMNDEVVWGSDQSYKNLLRPHIRTVISTKVTSDEVDDTDSDKASILRKSLYLKNINSGDLKFRANKTSVIKFDPRNSKRVNNPNKVVIKRVVTKKGVVSKQKGVTKANPKNIRTPNDNENVPVAAVPKKSTNKNKREEQMAIVREVYPMVMSIADASLIDSILN